MNEMHGSAFPPSPVAFFILVPFCLPFRLSVGDIGEQARILWYGTTGKLVGLAVTYKFWNGITGECAWSRQRQLVCGWTVDARNLARTGGSRWNAAFAR